MQRHTHDLSVQHTWPFPHHAYVLYYECMLYDTGVKTFRTAALVSVAHLSAQRGSLLLSLFAVACGGPVHSSKLLNLLMKLPDLVTFACRQQLEQHI